MTPEQPGIEYGGSEELALAKIEARQKLLAMPPLEAQKLVDMTLYPQYWSCNTEEFIWDESIPTYYGETDS
ncbi:hypothetical protein [Merismopedia glauca]|uniref:Uncharacterized protein n=1 Tax=Merismopedia glauca CCAP 1448/3 TaxID=1296344 RepID=A0A2T1BZV3_9CYAN|nr:hypothetical protein [Merismopedia glauca]PSB01403.1 hypothetical protein C7B64_18615 [Merismopedia glauca CCAP 1448/3]